MATILLVAWLCFATRTVAATLGSFADGLPNAGLNATEQIKYYGYPLESHDVTTMDGYILQLHRIPHGRYDNTIATGRPVALFIPGMLCTSGVLIINGPSRSLPLLLADLGYDVWIGNQRGSLYSRRHVEWDPWLNYAQYWNFSNHEIGVYDTASFIDYVLSSTGEEKLFFVGHSQGTTAFFILAAELPEYNEKIRLSVMLAPVAYLSHMGNPIGRILGEFVDVEKTVILDILQIRVLLPRETEIVNLLGQTVCQNTSPFVELCANLLFQICGYDSEQFNRTLFPLITGVAPAGTSVKALVHYGQNYKSGYFRQYDYGMIGNILHYGQFSPPVYNMSLVTAPVGIYYGSNDWLAAIEDVERVASEIRNLVDFYLVPWDKWNHLDFIWATDVYELLYDHVLQVIQKY